MLTIVFFENKRNNILFENEFWQWKLYVLHEMYVIQYENNRPEMGRFQR